MDGPDIGGKERGVAIAGPTASGKSGLALILAERHGGVVINADSMQIYSDLRVLTARPSPADEARAPHRLYGIADGASAFSAAAWALQAKREIDAARAQGRLPILVGGTGLYFRSLFSGLSDIPTVPEEIRAHWRARAVLEGPATLHAELARRDPATAARLRPSDPQRLVRALEVLDATGRSLSDFHADAATPPESSRGWKRLVLGPERSALAERIAGRFRAMVAEGAIEEVRALIDRRLAPSLPVMKAIGVAELGGVLGGAHDMDTAIALAVAATRRYAKRQTTWFRTQMPDWDRVDSSRLMRG